ncbi:hypothetical protein A3F37_02455 [Candidatus Saccharibacteria bacterium RIFCSPHIGHO2_12_FULL_41_12]|nr:MAG: hypothetical protein A3F37_02455 [Candidatus Saccharibacteria bacterium RIFCSPHIGHO2_12_FULL_41_12]
MAGVPAAGPETDAQLLESALEAYAGEQYVRDLQQPFIELANAAPPDAPDDPENASVQRIYERYNRNPDSEWLFVVADRIGHLATYWANPPEHSGIEKPIDVTTAEKIDIGDSSEATELLLEAVYAHILDKAENDELILDELEFARNEYDKFTPTDDAYATGKNLGRYIGKLWKLQFHASAEIRENTDPWTHLRNRRSLSRFQVRNEDEHGRLKDAKYMMIDLNDFGETNKIGKKGHTHGDMMLLMASGSLQHAAKVCGIDLNLLFRGKFGDEFVVVVPNAVDPDAADLDVIDPDEDIGGQFLEIAQQIFSEGLHRDDSSLEEGIREHRGIYADASGVSIVSISGAIADTLAEADSSVQGVKKRDKERRLAEYAKTRGEYPTS